MERLRRVTEAALAVARQVSVQGSVHVVDVQVNVDV
jgi:hypothetical protein